MTQDVFSQLPVPEWRGIQFPYVDRSASFEHDQALHKFVFRDNEAVEQLGSRNWVIRFTIPFREGIDKGPYAHLYLETFPLFLEAVRDRTEGELLDPVLGPLICKPLTWSDSMDVLRRDGEDVQVAFRHAPDPDEVEGDRELFGGLQAAKEEGRRLDDEIGRISEAELLALGLIDDDLGVPINPLDQLSGIGQQVSAQAGRFEAKIDSFAHRVEKVGDAFDALNKRVGTPDKAPAIRSARRLQDAVTRLHVKTTHPGRAIVTTIVGQDMPVGALANQLGLSQAQFFQLNPGVPIPIVPAGTTVNLFG